jgi:hypothetical protein
MEMKLHAVRSFGKIQTNPLTGARFMKRGHKLAATTNRGRRDQCVKRFLMPKYRVTIAAKLTAYTDFEDAKKQAQVVAKAGWKDNPIP